MPCQHDIVSHISKLVSDIAPLADGVKKSRKIFPGAGKFRKRLLEPRKRLQSIGNGFPGQKYVGAMVRWSIRVVLVAENEVSNPHCLSSDFQLRGRRRSRRSSLYFITRKNYFLFYTMSGGSHQLENVTHMLRRCDGIQLRFAS